MKSSTTIGQRFAELIGALGLSHNAFAKSIGKSSTTINYIVDDKSKPGFDILEATLTQYPNLNSDWLMNGRGDMFRVDAPATASQVEDSSYLREILSRLESSFLVELATKNSQIAGMQRTIDYLTSGGQVAQKSFNWPATTTEDAPIRTLNSKNQVAKAG